MSNVIQFRPRPAAIPSHVRDVRAALGFAHLASRADVRFLESIAGLPMVTVEQAARLHEICLSIGRARFVGGRGRASSL